MRSGRLCAVNRTCTAPYPRVHGDPPPHPPPPPPRLRLGELPDRRPPADPCVALPDLLHKLRRRGPPSTHVLQIRLDLVEASRPSVRHQQYGDAPPVSRHAPTRRPLAGPPLASRGARPARG